MGAEEGEVNPPARGWGVGWGQGLGFRLPRGGAPREGLDGAQEPRAEKGMEGMVRGSHLDGGGTGDVAFLEIFRPCRGVGGAGGEGAFRECSHFDPGARTAASHKSNTCRSHRLFCHFTDEEPEASEGEAPREPQPGGWSQRDPDLLTAAGG